MVGWQKLGPSLPGHAIRRADRELAQPVHDPFEALAGARCWQALKRVYTVAGEARYEIDM